MKVKKTRLEHNWFFVAACLVAYLLGVFTAGSAGRRWNWVTFACGLVIVGAFYFLQRILLYVSSSRVNLFTRVGASQRLQHAGLVYVIFALFALVIGAAYLLLKEQVLIGVNLLWLTGIALLVFFPISASARLWTTPYRWTFEGLIVSPLMIFLGSSLQSYSPAPLLYMISVPVLLLYCASAIALQFAGYARDVEQGNRTFLVGIGWERALRFHNVLIVLAYIAYLAYLYASGSWVFNWTAMLTIIISLLEVYLLGALAQGMKPNWPLLNSVAVMQFMAFLYLLIYALIVH